ncbi:unnamed protein product [Rangifer tarandus platyrhynchus]|uniref:Uncharacterized protein n=1 Tax=Rangifer tarandus platyrhynchus TaxID=3082113 RepID=A0AC59ZFC4_RANTA
MLLGPRVLDDTGGVLSPRFQVRCCWVPGFWTTRGCSLTQVSRDQDVWLPVLHPTFFPEAGGFVSAQGRWRNVGCEWGVGCRHEGPTGWCPRGGHREEGAHLASCEG